MSERWIQTVQALNQLLEDEMSAVESYNRALAIVGHYPEARVGLQECQASHLDRVLRLRSAILEMQGEPVTSSAAWGNSVAWNKSAA